MFTTAHVQQLHRIKRNICLYTISLYVVHKKCKRHNDKFLQNALPRSFHIKNVNIGSASFRDCSTVRVFDWYVQILHSEDDSKKKRNSCVLALWLCKLCTKSSPTDGQTTISNIKAIGYFCYVLHWQTPLSFPGSNQQLVQLLLKVHLPSWLLFLPSNLVRSWSFWSNLWQDITINIHNSKTWIAEGHCPIPNHHFGCSFHFFRVSSILQESMDVISSATAFLGAKLAADPIFRIMPSFPWFIVQMEVFYLDLRGRKAWVWPPPRMPRTRPATIPRTVEIMFINPSRLCCNGYVAKECAHGLWVIHSMHNPQKINRKEMNHHIIQMIFIYISHHFGRCFILKASRNPSFLLPFREHWPPKQQHAHLFGAVSPQGELHLSECWGPLGMEGPRDI